MIGFLGHVDVINDTGNTGHGFEIDLQGLQRIDMTDTYGILATWSSPSSQ